MYAQAAELVDLNVLAPVLPTQAVLPGMLDRSRGTIINIASLLAFSGAVQIPFLAQAGGVRGHQIVPGHLQPGAGGRGTRPGIQVQVQVVCPGTVRSEFHSRQGMDMSAVTRMEAGHVAQASLADLADGVLVSVPGLSDTEPLARLEAASLELMGASRVAELPAGYRRDTHYGHVPGRTAPVQPGRAMLRLIGMRAVKVAAAAAVVCVVALSACTASQRSPASVPPNITVPRSGGMPGYYVVVAGRDVVVRASADGHVTGSVAIPVAAGNAISPVGGVPFAGADDGHFVIVVSRGGDLPGVADVTLFQLTVSPDGRPGRLSQLTFGSTQGVPVTGAALSPNGRILALSLVHEFPAGPLHGSVEVVSVATGVARTWTGESTPGYWPGVPAWVGDGTVVVPWWHDTGDGTIPAEITGVRRLALGSRGGSLAAAPLTAFPVPVPDLESAMIAPGGGEVITSSCRSGHHTATAQVAELSAADGRLVRVLRTQTARFGTDADAADAVFSQCQVLSVADGDHVLIQAFGFGRVDNGVFTSLPGTTPRVLPVAAAW